MSTYPLLQGLNWSRY